MTLLDAPSLTTKRTTWTRVDEDCHVGSREGEYVGFVEATADGHFVGLDGYSTPVGRYGTLTEAQRAVEKAFIRAGEHRRSSATVGGAVMMQGAAVVSGVIACGTLLTAVLTLPGL